MRYLIIIICILSLASCRTKKKIVERQAFTVEEISAVEISSITENDIKVDSGTNTGTTTITTDLNEGIDVETADTEKEVTITKEEKDGKTVWTGTNVKKISVTKNNTKTEKKDTTNTNVTSVDKTKTKIEQEQNTKLAVDFSGRNTKVDIESTSSWVAFAIGLSLFILILIMAYKIYKKYRNKLPL